MSSDCIISIRSHELITNLFSEIQKFEGINQSKDRSAVVNRALEATAKRQINWRDVSNSFPSANKADDTFLKIRIEKKNIALLESIQEDIKKEFSLDKLKAPFMLKLLLGAYLRVLKQEALLSSTKSLVDFGIDGLVFKENYESADYPQADKKKLLSLTRKYLQTCNPQLELSIRTQMNDKIKAYSDYFNIYKYLPTRRSTLGSANIIFTSKVYAGLLILLSETGAYSLKEILDALEDEVNKEH